MPSPQQLVQAYDLHLADRWRRNDETPGTLEQWLEAHWNADGAPEPERQPDSKGPVGGTDVGLRVYDDGTSILGFVSSRRAGCFRLRVDEVMPRVPHGRLHVHATLRRGDGH